MSEPPKVKVIELDSVVPPPPTANPYPSMAEAMLVSGGVVSATVTVKLPVDVSPRASEEEQFTVVVPRGKVEPEAGMQGTARDLSASSFAGAMYITGVPLGPAASVVML